MNAVILFGAPGAGKGTTAERVMSDISATHVATGDMLREAVAERSALGREAESYMKKGELVPDELIIRVVEARLDSGGDQALYLFDGFPRTERQAELLEESLANRGGRILRVFQLEVPREVLIQRLSGRRVCRNCGRNYHVMNAPPKKEGVCDVCGGELYQRPDDREATIVNRLEVYQEQTADLIERYERQGVLVRVDGDQGADNLGREVAEKIKAELGEG